jgi:hypothetical protein
MELLTDILFLTLLTGQMVQIAISNHYRLIEISYIEDIVMYI